MTITPGDEIPITSPGAGPYTNYGSNYGVGRSPITTSGAPPAGPYTNYGYNYGRGATPNGKNLNPLYPSITKPWPGKGRWKATFNPPIISTASGARSASQTSVTDFLNGAPPEKGARDTVGSLNQADRVYLKGYLVPDMTYRDDWSVDTDSAADDRATDFSSTNNANIFGANNTNIYGFRFMYNPAVIDFGLGSTDGVNPGYLYSGKATAMPTGITSSAALNINFPISRVDDLLMLSSKRKDGNQYTQREIDALYGRVDRSQMKGQTGQGRGGFQPVTSDDLYKISTLGTMYDLEFLFRATLGKAWRTAYRGITADVGMFFSVPLILTLSNSMVYRVRLSSVGYSHKSFTPDMVPIYTELSLGFERIPDVIGWQ